MGAWKGKLHVVGCMERCAGCMYVKGWHAEGIKVHGGTYEVYSSAWCGMLSLLGYKVELDLGM